MNNAPKRLSNLLTGAGLTIATAESCTGGMLGSLVTSVGGSSAYFLGGIIAYSNGVKLRELGVKQSALRRCGAVSSTVAGQMAAGVRKRFGADIGVGITGIAGPAGGVPGKPVGTVFIGVACLEAHLVRRFLFRGGRQAVRKAACAAALDMLVELLMRLESAAKSRRCRPARRRPRWP